MATVSPPRDPLSTLREYRHLAPWNLRDIVAVASAILDAAGVTPINPAATIRPNERTIRFYVTRGLVTPPDGRGTAATYGYRHLLQILGIKLRQMEGATLEQIESELNQTSGDVLERKVAATLGSAFPSPQSLHSHADRPASGRAGRVLRSRLITADPEAAAGSAQGDGTTTWHRMTIADGVELHVSMGHPLARLDADGMDVAAAVRAAITRLLHRSTHQVGDNEGDGPRRNRQE